MRLITILALLATALLGQSPVVRTYKDGSGRLQYICTAERVQTPYSWYRSDFTITSIVDSGTTSTITTVPDHGWIEGSIITIQGSTTAALNGSYVVKTVPTTKTATITTSGVTDATYNEATLKITMSWPRLNARVWTLTILMYTGVETDPFLIYSAPGSVACADRANY